MTLTDVAGWAVIAVGAGMAILLTTPAFNLVGGGVRDPVDPRQQSQARGATDA